MTKDGIKTHHSWDKVRWVVASILLLAAIMKAWQLATVPMLGEGLFHARWFNLGLVEFELAFGLWLAFGFFPKLSRWATIGLFTAFAGVSLYKALTGEPSCGCFGSAQVNPWWTFVLDTVIVGVSFCCRSDIEHQKRGTKWKKQNTVLWMFRTSIIAIALFTVIVVQILLFCGSYIGIEPFVSSSEISFKIDDTIRTAERNTVPIAVTNKTEEPITVIGIKNMLCASGGVIKGLPIEIQSGEKIIIVFIALDTDHQELRSKQKQRLLFYVDKKGAKKINVVLPLYMYLANP